MSSAESTDEQGIRWWQALIVGILLLAGNLAHIIFQGGIRDPLTVGALLVVVFASYMIYDAIEDYRTQRKEARKSTSPSSGQKTNGELRSLLEGWQARGRSVSVVIYTWFTVGFIVIFLLPSTEWWVPVRLLVLTAAGVVIWIRSGGKGPAETSKERMKRFGAGVAGVLSGLVIALSIHWLSGHFL